jgi:hypothetical protein
MSRIRAFSPFFIPSLFDAGLNSRHLKFARRLKMCAMIPSYTLPGGMMEISDDDDILVNDALGSIHAADSSGTDEELETGDAKVWNFPTRED